MNTSGVVGVRKGKRSRNLKATSGLGAGEVDGCRRRSGELRTPFGMRCFRYAGTETGDAYLGG